MTDYSAMSDFEINKLVAKRMGHQCYYDNNSYTNDGLNVTVTGNGWQGWYNPTRDAYAAWPIIIDNHIGIAPYPNRAYAWSARHGMASSLSAEDKNPLRAAMIVYLMIKESESS